MGLKAGLSELRVEATDLRYKKPSPQDSTREYDACYYEVTLDEAVLATHNPTQLHVQITAKTGMNVYIYGGKSRTTATESVIAGNAQASAGATYSIDVEKGFLVVAYPNEGVEGEFGFNYWIDAELKPAEPEDEDLAVPIEPNEAEQKVVVGAPDENNQETEATNTVVQQQSLEGQSGSSPNPTSAPTEYSTESNDMLFYILCAGAGVLFITIVILCYKCRGKGKITTASGHDLAYPSGNNTNERSLHLEEMDEEIDPNNDTNRPSLPK